MTQTLPEAEYSATEPADMVVLLDRAYELGETLIRSDFAAEYAYWKAEVLQDANAQSLKKQFLQAKEKFAECERFGRFHPDYNAALEQVYEAQQRLDEVESVRKYKAAESTLDELLTDISRTLAFAVSQSIKVPDNNPNPKASGCGNGGSCSCGSGGCG
ncbi:YlbF family regulator [Cohnella cellulosilytica]|uniref:YlbF family regulator n=2 Tax=Cohnella cellulosilytica TaxID=986710 RepID=A0ABW2F775_9BACL